jgi:hypothetical protein
LVTLSLDVARRIAKDAVVVKANTRLAGVQVNGAKGVGLAATSGLQHPVPAAAGRLPDLANVEEIDPISAHADTAWL